MATSAYTPPGSIVLGVIPRSCPREIVRGGNDLRGYPVASSTVADHALSPLRGLIREDILYRKWKHPLSSAANIP